MTGTRAMSADPQLIEQARSADPDARQKAAYLVAHIGRRARLPADVRAPRRQGLARAQDHRRRLRARSAARGRQRTARRAGRCRERRQAQLRHRGADPDRRRRPSSRSSSGCASRPTSTSASRSSTSSAIFAAATASTCSSRSLEGEPDINVSSSIVSSLGKYRDAAALPHLLRVLQREDLWLKFHAIEALGEIGDRAALPAILPLYEEKSLRKPVLEAIGKIADVGTVSLPAADHRRRGEAEPHRVARARAHRRGEQAEDRGTGGAAAHPAQVPRVVPGIENRSADRAPARHAEARRARRSSSSSSAGRATSARCRC